MRLANPILKASGIFALAISALSCSTEVEVNAPYQETKVIYAILDPQQPFQIVRISKGFLNEGQSALDLAKNPSASNYDPGQLEVTLTEYKNRSANSPKIDSTSWVLYDTTYHSKESGVFYSPDQIIFRTPAMQLETNLKLNPKYKVSVKNKQTQSVAFASTPVCGAIGDLTNTFIDPSPYVFPDPPKPIPFGFKQKAGNPFSLKLPANCEVMEIRFVWNVKTIRSVNGAESTQTEQWVWNQPGKLSFTKGSGNSPDIASGGISAGAFYSFLKTKNDDATDNANVVSRQFQNSELEISMATGEYRKYAEVNGNYNVITQSKPVYSNVSNGLGLVAAKTKFVLPVSLKLETIDSARILYPNLKLL